MKPISKLYIKVFLITGLLYASIMIIWGFIDGDPFRIWKYLFYVISFGGAMSLTLVSLHKANLSDQGITNPSEENLKAIQQAEFISAVSKDEFISRLSNDKIMSRMKIETDEETIKLISGITWKSWGETIRVKISSVSEGMFKYHIISKPKLPITIVDFGKNLENILLIKKLVKIAD